MRLVVGGVGVLLLGVSVVAFALAQVWGVVRWAIRAKSPTASSIDFAQPGFLARHVMVSGVLLLSGGAATGCLLVAAGVVGSLWTVAITSAVGLARWVAVSVRSIRHAARLRVTGATRPQRPSRLTGHTMTTIVFGATLCPIIANEARFREGWSQGWRISTAAGIGIATLVAFLFEIPRSPSHARQRVVLAGTLAGGPIILLLAGAVSLTSWEQGVVTELGVGLSLVGIINVLIRDSSEFRALTDKAELATAEHSIDAAAADLLAVEAFVFRRNVDKHRVHDPAEHDTHLKEAKELVTLARTDQEEASAAAHAARRKERDARVRAAIDELLPAIAKEYGVCDEPWHTRLRGLANVVANTATVAPEDVNIELRAAARIIVVKKTAVQMRRPAR
jgi:hypothetical protein